MKFKKIIIFVLCLFTSFELFLIFHPKGSMFLTKSSKLSIEEYANTVLTSCGKTGSKSTCYDKEIPRLMNVLSMEEAFAVTKIVQEKDRSFLYCHVLGHNISSNEVKKDPSKWKDVLTRCPSGVCSNGCLHGGLQERFRSEYLDDKQIEEIKHDLATICEPRNDWHPTGLEQASCYHAIGHLNMYLSRANITKATEICDEIGLKKQGSDYTRVCYDGAFMQIFQPLDPDDFALIKGKEQTKETVDTFCNTFTGSKKAACISESWPLFREELVRSPNDAIAFCNKAPGEEKTRCYHSLFYVVTTQLAFDAKSLSTYCRQLPQDVGSICFSDVASRLIETDYRFSRDAVSFCDNAPSYAQEACFETLTFYATYNFKQGSNEAVDLCELFPELRKAGCLKALEKTTR